MNDLQFNIDALDDEQDTFHKSNVVIKSQLESYMTVDLALPSRTLWARSNVCAQFQDDKYPLGSCGKLFRMLEIDSRGFSLQVYSRNFQMPTDEQFDELLDDRYTEKSFENINGKEYFCFTSKVNGRKLYIPASSASLMTYELNGRKREYYIENADLCSYYNMYVRIRTLKHCPKIDGVMNERIYIEKEEFPNPFKSVNIRPTIYGG